jgi:lysophospholipase L1-like esterase
LNQPDGIHPNAEGTRMVADTVWPVLRSVLDQMGTAQ